MKQRGSGAKAGLIPRRPPIGTQNQGAGGSNSAAIDALNNQSGFSLEAKLGPYIRDWGEMVGDGLEFVLPSEVYERLIDDGPGRTPIEG